MNEGWFKVYRCLFKKAIWLSSTPEQKVILITLLGMANHEGKEWEWKGKQYKALAGQFVTSTSSIMDKSGKGISRQNVRTALKKFQNYGFLTYESTKTGMLVNIVNWSVYQREKLDANLKITNESPSTNQVLTTNKNDKKYIYIYEFSQNKLLIQTIVDFMKMRDQIKKPMTDRALHLMLNKLKQLSDNEEMQIKILEKSIENCWQGIFQLKEERYGSTRQNIRGSKKKFNVKIPKWKPESNAKYTEDEPF